MEFDLRAVFEQIANLYRNLNQKQKIIIFSTLIGVVAFISFLLVFRVDEAKVDDGYRVLFDNISPADAALILQQLEKDEIPYKLTDETTIKVPKEIVYEQRLKVASTGLPKTTDRVGFELFDKKEFGETEFDQNVKYIRALEGELSKTVESLAPIATASVRLAIPKDTVFVSKQTPPSASVAITLKEEMTLNNKQIRGIKNLVAASVSKLTPENVQLINENGEPLGDDSAAALTDESVKLQLKYKSDVEKSLENKIVMLLAPFIGGKDRVVAKVTIDFDFTEQSTTEEKYDPNSVIRSEQEMEEKREGTKAKEVGGVPGAVSNIGPVEGLDGDNKEKYEKTQATRNYEIGKTVSNVKREFAIMKRITAAVVVDGKYEEVTNEDGSREIKYNKLPPEQIAQIQEMVKQSIGFNQARSDEVSVSNFQFDYGVTKKTVETSSEQYLKMAEPFLPYLKYVFAIVILYIFYKLVILPFTARMVDIKTEEEEENDAVLKLSEIEQDEDELNKMNELRAKIERDLGLGRDVNESNLKAEVMFQRIKEQIEKNPEEAATMIESLLLEEDEAKNSKRGY